MKIVVDFDLCEANAVCMEIAPEIFQVDDNDELHILMESPGEEYRKKVEDEWRGEVKIVGLSSGRIPWPMGKAGRNKSLVVYRGLAKAITRESIVAVAYWWGVTTQTVTKWRRKLGITGRQTKGTSKLRSVHFEDFGDSDVCILQGLPGAATVATDDATSKVLSSHQNAS